MFLNNASFQPHRRRADLERVISSGFMTLTSSPVPVTELNMSVSVLQVLVSSCRYVTTVIDIRKLLKRSCPKPTSPVNPSSTPARPHEEVGTCEPKKIKEEEGQGDADLAGEA